MNNTELNLDQLPIINGGRMEHQANPFTSLQYNKVVRQVLIVEGVGNIKGFGRKYGMLDLNQGDLLG